MTATSDLWTGLVHGYTEALGLFSTIPDPDMAYAVCEYPGVSEDMTSHLITRLREDPRVTMALRRYYDQHAGEFAEIYHHLRTRNRDDGPVDNDLHRVGYEILQVNAIGDREYVFSHDLDAVITAAPEVAVRVIPVYLPFTPPVSRAEDRQDHLLGLDYRIIPPRK